MIRFTILLIIGFLSVIPTSKGQGEKNLSEIVSFLDSMSLDFYMPVENEVRFLKPRKNEFFSYDEELTKLYEKLGKKNSDNKS